MLKKRFQLVKKEEENKYIRNIFSFKNKGIIFKLEWNTSDIYSFLNPLTKFFDKHIGFKK